MNRKGDFEGTSRNLEPTFIAAAMMMLVITQNINGRRAAMSPDGLADSTIPSFTLTPTGGGAYRPAASLLFRNKFAPSGDLNKSRKTRPQKSIQGGKVNNHENFNSR